MPQLTVEERIRFLHQHSPGAERLGIGPFTTGTEALHGVAWLGPATSLPQPVGMAATWDPGLLREAGQAVATEVRHMRQADPAISLTVWAPVVNTLRHPRWGRTEEAYTEDPLLNAELATGYAEGLRGDGENWTTVPTLKHFLGYSNETDRSATSSQLDPQVLEEYELPGFLVPLQRGAAGSVMLSYNLVNGRPAHVSELVGTRLRSAVADPDLLFVVTDAGAPSNLWKSEKVFPDAPTAYAAMLRSGVDSFTDHDSDPSETIAAVTQALNEGLITEEHIDHAVVRQLVARARTGEFDSLMGLAESNGTRAIDRTEARSLSREVATRSVVLLGHGSRGHDVLPIAPHSTVAVIGTQAHEVLRDWYSGELIAPVTLVDELSARQQAPIRSTEAIEAIHLSVPVRLDQRESASSTATPAYVHTGDDGSLRISRPDSDGPLLSDHPAVLEVIDFGEGILALRGETGRYLCPDDYGQLAFDAESVGGWVSQELFRREPLPNGHCLLVHRATGRYVGTEHHSGALTLRGTSPDSGTPLQAHTVHDPDQAFTDAADGADVVIVAVGNNPHVHGRETEDRPHTRLPEPDRRLVQRLRALPAEVATVLVITSSYPYDLEGLDDGIDAVIWSSHLGQSEGEALADVLTGARDFSGRLAQTWPIDSELPDLLDYNIIRTKSTYLYGQPHRFPFGHGLSVDTVHWDRVTLELGHSGVSAHVDMTAPRQRRTQGPLHDVVQVYADLPARSFSRRPLHTPETRLVGFATVTLPPGQEHASVDLMIPLERLAVFASDTSCWELPDGAFQVRVARSSSPSATVCECSFTLPEELTGQQQTSSAAAPAFIGTDRAEELRGLVRAATTPTHGEELRPQDSSGTCDFILPAGTRVTALRTRRLPAPGTSEPPSADVVDTSTGKPLPLPLSVSAEEPYHRVGRLRIRLRGPVALLGIETTAE
ncbi:MULTISPECIES: glycoside hydrolase family 3 C-terminal domain-containing protein [unclassified Actinomyces]|uniref:glycoside hydrolase family 3 C-terminal domain-containing protein n=1 Tax=unclassified Actinomyces TaxID=2609248 RepID=UPI002017E328|nr:MULTISPECIES: glycoside hydrolase family 3 C-terminal domain-containing protein [unclassified Actinomyces]MCL3778229.1 glycoside hydrolase family 3 C-terminal domain-containing protein [Actinomyces sp. AC-20-1]MCL3789132.1 glycoside hydrolase family 3 C-terminal domain-containing protein [Actinomyces sp. 187325]MCL3791487.1 glycoside hydrolase family 3 C-terminal domain-containing protein [Actinomyces sp. 186855]MCL3794077.1 glycoside hydrolase family 3 C-terminal domain-containing protein [